MLMLKLLAVSQQFTKEFVHKYLQLNYIYGKEMAKKHKGKLELNWLDKGILGLGGYEA